MTAPGVVPAEPVARRPRGFAVGLLLGLLLTAGPVVAIRTGALPEPALGSGSSSDADDADDDVPFSDPVRLQGALDAAVAEVGSDRATQVVVEAREFAVVLFDPATNLWTRYQEYAFDRPGDGRSEPLPAQPPAEAEFPLGTVSAAGLTAALVTGNRAIGNDADEVGYLQLVAERPFPVYGDVLLTVVDRYSAGARAWLSPAGEVLRSEVG
ncbi:hypothetical protein SAMN03159343_0127 [Klenkia marina]|uniref:Uncharacterized protein n=1 Tax=Klenkia marina TaxID=1960309 RepID=A0A1G4X8K4_9ACTN|nr:hypothetical protein [Klenkia marina]SCX37530.1 hypothetical protein SAMN03159343_0127 [Klenkia marina]